MTVKMNTKGLDAIITLLKKSDLRIRVGILGSNASGLHSDSKLTNAQIGSAHEFGTSRLPVRSFLRMPLTTKLYGALKSGGAFEREAMKRVLKEGSYKPFLDRIGATCVNVVLGAFDTGGYGTWKPSNMADKENHQTLVETGQLRNSITWELTKNNG